MYTRIFVILLSLSVIASVFGQNEPGAKWMPSPHFYSGRNGHIAKYLIIHGTAGGSSAEAIGQWFQNPDSQAATHYVVGQDGTVVQCVLESNAAWGNGRIETGADTWWSSSVNPNYLTISIEHVKSSTDNSNELTVAQQDASFKLIKNIVARNPSIQKLWAGSNGGITGHFSVSPGSRARCPGPFPWAQMYQSLNGEQIDETHCVGNVTADVLNIRREPNSQSPVVGTLGMGVHRFRARRTGESINGNDGWLFYQNGYVSAYYVSTQNPKPTWCY